MPLSEQYFTLAINPEPWAVGPLGVGFRGRTPYPYMGPNHKVQAYQEAVREALVDAMRGKELITGEVELKLYIWRRIESMTVYGGRNRKAKTSDATNIQKATEDAIQGVIIENDRQVRRVCTEIVQQDEDAEPCVVVAVKPYTTQGLGLPDHIWQEVDRVTKAPVIPNEGMLWVPDDTDVEDAF